jgi:hypothetical protein
VSYDDWKLASPDRRAFGGTRVVAFELAGFTLHAHVNGDLDEIELYQIDLADGSEIERSSKGFAALESFLWIRFREDIVKESWTKAMQQGRDYYYDG